MNGSRVEVDWTEVKRGVIRLTDGITEGSRNAARDVAAETASAIHARVPVRTGRLAATVGVVDIPEGAAVTYGGGLPYAGYIEGRAHPVEGGIAAAEQRFARAETEMAAKEVRKL